MLRCPVGRAVEGGRVGGGGGGGGREEADSWLGSVNKGPGSTSMLGELSGWTSMEEEDEEQTLECSWPAAGVVTGPAELGARSAKQVLV